MSLRELRVLGRQRVRSVGTVRRDPKNLEQMGDPRYLTDDNQPLEHLEGRHRCLKTGLRFRHRPKPWEINRSAALYA